MQRLNLAADIPESLADADEALSKYGRWAAERESIRRCGSAEGMYRPEGWEAVEERRTPAPLRMSQADALVCQRALARVPTLEQKVLVMLYIPQRIPVPVQARLMRIPPSLCQERHIRGLRMFDNIRRSMCDTLAPT